MTERCIARKIKKNRKKIEKLQKKLKGLPEGKFILARNGRHYKWYVSDGKTKTYIPKENLEYAQQLAYKNFLFIQIANLEQEIKALQAYQKHRSQKLIEKETDCLRNPEYLKLLSPYISKEQKDIIEWFNEAYPKNEEHPETLIHETADGNVVRSKSESMIEMLLLQHNLQFKYEKPLLLGNIVYHPDFQISHPRESKIVIWENIGKIDDPKYVRRFILKFQDYIANGYIPGVNLIFTFETSDHPLTAESIEKIIEIYFEE